MKKIICLIMIMLITLSLIGCNEKKENLEVVTLKYVSQASELIPLLSSGTAEYGVLGEPAVTQANTKAGTGIVLDLQQEYKKATKGDFLYTQAGVLIKNDLYQDKKFVHYLYQALENNKSWLIENVNLIKDKLEQVGSTLKINFTQDIIERCNLGSMPSKDIKEDIEKYYSVIKDFDKTFIGGELPTQEFYAEFEKNVNFDENYEDNGELIISVPDGAPVLAVLSLHDKNLAGYKIKVNVLSDASLVMSTLTNGTSKIVVLPTNVCAKLFNKKLPVRLLSVNIFGVLYMVGKDENVQSLKDLRGKTVYNIGVGGTPDLTLKYILTKNNIGYKE